MMDVMCHVTFFLLAVRFHLRGSQVPLLGEGADVAVQPRYKLSYTAQSTPFPLFTEHRFWDALCGADGTHFARTAVACINPMYNVTADHACVALTAGLHPMVYYLPPIQTWQRIRRRPSREELADAPPLTITTVSQNKETLAKFIPNTSICETDSDATKEGAQKPCDPSKHNRAMSICSSKRTPQNNTITIFGHEILTLKDSRYKFVYPILSPITTHRFWDALCGPDGIYFAESALVCSNPAYGIDLGVASVALSVGLRPFRLAISRLTENETIPTDITEFLVRVRSLISMADDFDPEWWQFQWPPTGCQLSFASPNQPWQVPDRKPARRELDDAPPLSIVVHHDGEKRTKTIYRKPRSMPAGIKTIHQKVAFQRNMASAKKLEFDILQRLQLNHNPEALERKRSRLHRSVLNATNDPAEMRKHLMECTDSSLFRLGIRHEAIWRVVRDILETRYAVSKSTIVGPLFERLSPELWAEVHQYLNLRDTVQLASITSLAI
ncbi:hypothetical protein B0H12DRAFT_1070271 [Mycena haematopus]|nr:hypothetical protein B0H12DRAFT_1070271 [Mycena haematopus]